ncbi:hypothetical protein KPL71_007941 [Citrus sinensis]|uniref:Uncharacterized protein n=1 Tax=Citrus sinensis TaxID=2711 RepID=A0ACB8M3M2_CITSI|nr:hypothetical protein KPL71_007941 [Citrus sinensis]
MEDNECRDGGNKVRLAIMELTNMISVPMSLTAAIRLHVPDAIWQGGANTPLSASQLRRVLGASRIWRRKENECDEDDDWESVEEGPAEIIWQGNEIIIRKKKVRVPKKDANPLSKKEDVDRPTSNPLPPQSEAFADHQNAQQALETVAQQDKAHCPLHLKTGACRFGQRCSRVHFYPNKSCTLLIKNMYNGPGLAWEQDEGLEWVLTTWTDDECKLIMENCYKALPAGGKLIACEPVLPDDSNESQRTRALLEGDILL